MTYDYCTSLAIVMKAGVYVNQNLATSAAVLSRCYDDAAGFVNGMTRYDWNANSGAVTANFKLLLADTIGSLAATSLISQDMSGYTSRGEAESIINVLYDRAMKAIKVLSDSKLKNKMGVTE